MGSSGIVCIAVATQIYGDLAGFEQADISFAASIYIEMLAWFFQIHLVHKLNRNQVNAHFLVPIFMSNMCRAYFWQLAYPEMAPLQPTGLTPYFPDALCGTHYMLCAQT